MKMKISTLCIACLVFISSCARDVTLSPENRIIDIETSLGQRIGRGVIIDRDTLLTADHVYRECMKVSCIYRSPYFPNIRVSGGEQKSNSNDARYLKLDTPVDITPLEFARIHTGIEIYRYTLSGEYIRGQIIALDQAYIGYDTSLSGSIYASGIEIDIPGEPGESGTPVWSLSGALIGVMSASDREGKRGWVVR